jgi:ADP-L-glycero-D-manno-heptose 6-epimerase
VIIVTGGAGFIGSAVIAALNERGEKNILLVDAIDHDEKEHNIGHLLYERLVDIGQFREQLVAGAYDSAGVKAIIHLGACSDTAEQDWDYLADNNVAYSQDVIRWCFDRGVRCIYASSGAVYGNGSEGYSDNHDLFERFEPLNLYGKSKLLVDTWARDGGYLEKVAGLRYFNVFGPNEYHKNDMRSVIAKKFEELHQKGIVTLFKSYHSDYQDGQQKRDFIYITDAVAITLFFLDKPRIAGVYNAGTGVAATWNEVAKAMCGALNVPTRIKYVAMPKALRDQYQYFTQADMTKLKKAGWRTRFVELEAGVRDYVTHYLVPHRHLGEKRLQ